MRACVFVSLSLACLGRLHGLFQFALSPEGLTSQRLDSRFRDQGTVVKVQVLAVQSHGSISGFAAYVLQFAVDGLSSDWRRGAQEGFVQG